MRLTSKQATMLMDVNDDRIKQVPGGGALRTFKSLEAKGLISRVETGPRIYLTDRGAKWLCNHE